jgi:hypothetical protein
MSQLDFISTNSENNGLPTQKNASKPIPIQSALTLALNHSTRYAQDKVDNYHTLAPTNRTTHSLNSMVNESLGLYSTKSFTLNRRFPPHLQTGQMTHSKPSSRKENVKKTWQKNNFLYTQQNCLPQKKNNGLVMDSDKKFKLYSSTLPCMTSQSFSTDDYNYSWLLDMTPPQSSSAFYHGKKEWLSGSLQSESSFEACYLGQSLDVMEEGASTLFTKQQVLKEELSDGCPVYVAPRYYGVAGSMMLPRRVWKKQNFEKPLDSRTFFLQFLLFIDKKNFIYVKDIL